MTDINALSRELYGNARDKGFYEHEDWLRRQLTIAENAGEGNAPHARTQLAEHYGNRLLLIAGEAVEAHEEVRGGHGVAELYFSDQFGNNWSVPADTYSGDLYKPEGVLAELADVAIRTLETMKAILDQASYDEMTKLRGQVPVSIATTHHTGDGLAEDNYPPIGADPVNVAEVILLKHRFNLSRAPKHGGKAF